MNLLNVHSIKCFLWRNHLPWLSQNNANKGTPYNYFSVFFKDVGNTRYEFHFFEPHQADDLDEVYLKPFLKGNIVKKNINEIIDLDAEIIHHKKDYSIHYKNIISFAVDRYLKLITIKTAFARFKGKLTSGLKSGKETLSSDRYNLLRLLVEQYVNQRPSRASSGFTLDEVISMLYGTLWYKHIKNESFRRRIKLLLESLVITGDLTENAEVYYVQGQSISTLVEFEKEERRATQQLKMHKNIVRFMLVITIATLLIILVLLAMAGIVDLHSIWQKILQIKPLRFIMKFL